MAGKKYIANNAGTLTEIAATQVSVGAGNANDIGALDSTGHFDPSLMPVGVAADVAIITTSEALAAGDLVNVFDSAGSFKVRKADAATSGKEAHGFVIAAFGSAAPATVYFEGSDNQVSGLTPGVRFLSATTPGGSVATAPSAAGQVVQRVGFATTTTSLNFQSQPPVVLA